MIIKFSNNFESIFYAVLLANITGHFLVSKDKSLGLFEDEEFIDIDSINWRQTLEDHNKKYGDIKWFDYNNPDFFEFKRTIVQVLQKNKANKYKEVIILIKQALKFGLTPSLENKFQKDFNQPEVSEQINPFLIFDKRLI
jgi:hypothetical protein